jgi:hypothetical protein
VQLRGGGFGFFPHAGDFRAGGGEALVVGVRTGLQGIDSPQGGGYFPTHLGDAAGQARVRLLDPGHVFAAGRQLFEIAGAEDRAGRVRRAALVDRDETVGEHAPRPRQARSRLGQVRLGATHGARQPRGPFFASLEQPAEPFLARTGRRSARLGLAEVRLRGLQPRCQRARFFARRGELRFEGADVGGSRRPTQRRRAAEEHAGQHDEAPAATEGCRECSRHESGEGSGLC